MGFREFERFIAEGGECSIEGALEERDLQVAVAVLLLSVLETSSSGKRGEAVHALRKSMLETFKLDDHALGDIFETAETLVASSERCERILGALKQQCSTDDRVMLFKFCCAIVEADQVAEHSEVARLSEIGSLLELSIEQQMLARSLAEQQRP